jgi:hypothetical protein
MSPSARGGYGQPAMNLTTLNHLSFEVLLRSDLGFLYNAFASTPLPFLVPSSLLSPNVVH